MNPVLPTTGIKCWHKKPRVNGALTPRRGLHWNPNATRFYRNQRQHGTQKHGGGGMNYYPFHLGDYASHTGHLEPMEDLAYRRMLDAYYLRETPLPAPVPDVARLVRMRQHITEVEAVLNEFFLLTSEGWRHSRCDEEIAKMQDKQAASSEKVTHERDRMRRHRERRSEMFEALRNVGITPAWDISIKDLQQLYNTNCNAPETHLKREQVVSANAPATAIPTPTPTPVINTPIPPAQQAPGASGSKATAISLAAWLSNLKASGELPIPEDDPVFEYAEQAGIPLDMLRLCWIEFRSRYSEPGAKRYKDWRSVYRKAVRGNWLKLWFCNADGYTLTTAGLQAQRALQAKEGAAA